MILTFFLPLLMHSAFALEARWLGVSGILLKDDETTIMIDPVITKPKLTHWLLNRPFSSNQDKVKEKLKAWGVSKVDGLFISHCHFDHASDVAFLSSHLKAPVHGGDSLKKIVNHTDPTSPFVPAKDGSEFQIGKFKVKMYRRSHPAIIRSIDWHFLGGVIENFSGKFYDYQEGEVWMFIIEHPDGISIFDQSSVFFEESRKYAGRVHNYFLGISNPKDKNTLVEENVKILSPKRVIGIHHDFFFLESESMEKWLLPTVDVAHLKAEIEKLNQNIELIIPENSNVIKLDPL